MLIRRLSAGTTMRSVFFGNVAAMMTGNIFAQALTLLTTPVISRIFLPEAFGGMSVVWTLVGLFNILSRLNYEKAIVIEPDSGTAYNILMLCLLLTFGFGVATSAGLLLFKEPIVTLFKLGTVDGILWFLPVGGVIYSIFQAYSFWYSRINKFRSLAAYQGAVAAISQAAKIFLGLAFGSSAALLLLGNITGFFIPAVLMVLAVSRNSLPLSGADGLSLRRMAVAARKYQSFPKYQLPASFLNHFSSDAIFLAFAAFYSPEFVGLFGFTRAVIRRPLDLVAQSLTNVYLRKLSEARNAGKNLKSSFLKMTMGLTLIGIVPFGILAVGGSFLFSAVFGKNWGTSGLYAQILAPWFLLLLINTPATQVLIVLQRVRFLLLFNLLNTGARIGAVVGLGATGCRPELVLGAVSALGVLFNLYYILYAYQKARHG